MRYLLILFLVMVFVIGCGCGNVLTLPAYAQDDKDVWPIFYGTDNGGPDNGYIVFWDEGDAAWDAPRLVDNDLLNAQWTPQRNAVGWRGGRDLALNQGGQWNVSFIEATGNDLEIWESPDDGWQDEAGAWAMTDNDASENWTAVDVETRQNYVWAGILDPTPAIQNWYIDLSAGVPAWTNTGGIIGNSSASYSIILDDNLLGVTHIVYDDLAGAVNYEYVAPGGEVGTGIITIAAAKDYPQIIADSENRLWCFYTSSNVLQVETSFDIPDYDNWRVLNVALYTATLLTDDYHATWLMMDDTIHVVLVDNNQIAPNSTYLIYLRRTPNGWSAPVTLLTVDSSAVVFEDLEYPQITVDPVGNIFVSYILNPDWTAGPGGDLQGFHLDKDDYSNPIVGNWTPYLNIDQSGVRVVWAIMDDYSPVIVDM